jgi:thiamine biosynthesis lipoprotein
MKPKRLLILLGIIACCLALWRKQPAGPTVLSGRAMGCEWKLLTDEKVPAEELRAGIAAVIEHWEQVLSTWRPDSDLSRHNRGELATADLTRVLGLAEQLRADTGGTFDHRMLAQLTAAGFGPGGTGIDLSSIGKGFAVDRVAELLHQRGIRRYVFSLAGEVRAGEGAWPVAIESPAAGTDRPAEMLALSGQAMATSGNYRQWNGKDGDKIASHILDPATGRPALRPPCSVTVVAPDAALASGWATALFVAGPEAGSRAADHGLQVLWHGSPD